MTECVNCGSYTKFNSGLCLIDFENPSQEDDLISIKKFVVKIAKTCWGNS